MTSAVIAEQRNCWGMTDGFLNGSRKDSLKKWALKLYLEISEGICQTEKIGKDFPDRKKSM